MLNIYVDGSSLGNPGKSGVGYLIYDDKGTLIKNAGVHIGIQTNNFAEYMALIFPLIEIISMGEKQCKVFSDSKLVCEQIKGNFKVKNQNIYPLFILAKNLISKLDKFSIQHIDRERNEEADKLARKASGFLT
ncbi:MAG: ribonuclease HI family protein [Candidatus Omnitrophota bacterium]